MLCQHYEPSFTQRRSSPRRRIFGHSAGLPEAKIHHHGWFINKRPDGNHTLHPPGQAHYGPAHAPERAASFNLVRERPANPMRTPSNPQSRAPQPSATPGQTDQDGPAGEANPRAGPSPPPSRSNGGSRLFALT